MRNKGIYYKLLFILFFTGLTFFVLLTLLYVNKQKQEKLIFDETEKQFSNEISTLISISGREIVQTVNDYTYWDDFYENVNKKDTLWFENNIGSILVSFNADYVCVFDTAFRMVYESANEDFNFRDFIKEETIRKLKDEKLMNYYMHFSDTILEISSGSIHPTNDPTRSFTQSKGYFYIVRNFNHYVIEDITGLLNAECIVSESSDTIKIKERFIFNSEKLLNDWQGQPTIIVNFTKKFESLELFTRLSRNMFLMLIISLIFSLFVFQISLRSWVIKPLKLVLEIFKTEDQLLITRLKKYSGEFEILGFHFEQYIHQKQELIEAKEKAEESDRLKSSFLANMSHEIRTPMNGVLGFASLLKDSVNDEKERIDFLTLIEASGERMLNLINDIMDVSKIESGQMKAFISKTNIIDIVEYVYSFFKPETELKGLDFVLRKDPLCNEFIIMTDKEKIEAVLINLVKNAIKFTNSGSIEFGFKFENDFLKFYVRDTGIGVNSEDARFIFDRFRKGNEKLKKNYEGTGLGLSISKAYVEMLGGKIWMESELGVGSVFFFTIPVSTKLE